MTLESQYKQFLKHNPDSTFSFNEWMKWHSHQMEQAIIQMMKDDEELGLYEEKTKCYCGHTTYCDCIPLEVKIDILDFNQIVKEPKQEPCNCIDKCLGYLTKTCKRIEEHNYLQGFINQFEEEGEYQELSNDDWTVSRFLEWLKHNNFKIIKNAN